MAQDVPIGSGQPSLVALNDRSREIFRQIVDSYLATGEPVGSRNLARLISMPLSPASVRNVMQDLEELGLIYAPHTSAGRLPTERGLRFFVDALMQVGDLSERDRAVIEGQVAAAGKSVENVLNEVSGLLLGPHPRGRRRADRQVECPSQAHRVRPARARTGARRAGRRRWPGREPHRQPAARPADLGADRGLELPQRAHSRQDARRGQGRRSRRRWRRRRPRRELDALTQRIVAAGLARAGRAARAPSAS